MVGFALNIHNRGRQSGALAATPGGVVGLEVTGRPLIGAGGGSYLPVGGSAGGGDEASLIDAVDGAEASLLAGIRAAAEKLRKEIRAGAYAVAQGRATPRGLP